MKETETNWERKKYRLEVINTFLSVLSPILVLFFGIYINQKLDAVKDKEQKIDIMQKMVPQIFDTKTSKLVLISLLDSLDPVMCKRIVSFVVQDFAAKAINMDSNTVSYFKQAMAIGGPLADTLKAIDKKAQIKRMDAGDFEQKGFDALLKKNLAEAIENFSQAEKIYPTYHQVYEIRNFLQANNSQLKDPSSDNWKTAFKKIATNYQWKMPEDVKQKLLKE